MDKTLLYVGGAAAAYFLFLKPGAAASALLPGSTTATVPAVTNPASMVGINSGIRGGNGSFYLCSNYAQLAAADPNLMNPNYQMTAAQVNVYLSNYLDLQQGLPGWIGQKDLRGIKSSTLNQCAQEHWSIYGCAEKRIFYPMQPVSSAAYIPPPPAPKSSGGGSSFLSTALSIAGSVVALLGDETPVLNDADIQLLFTMSAVIKDILPLYSKADPLLTAAIEQKLNSVLNQYA